MALGFRPAGSLAVAGRGRVGTASSTGDIMSYSGKLQMLNSPTWRSSPLTEGAFMGNTAGPLGFSSKRFGRKDPGGQRRSASAGSLAASVAEVRALSSFGDMFANDTEALRGSHDALVQRLRSRSAKQEAEQHRAFLADYRSMTTAAAEAKLDKLLRETARRAEELRVKSEELQLEVADAERRLERANAQSVGRATEMELQAMNAFERSHKRIQEDKREEELQRFRGEAKAGFDKAHRKLQTELVELRDNKVLLREFRRAKLEKLQDMLGRVTDGRRLRFCVREMIRHGAQRILQRLDSVDLSLEPWMRDVLVNGCHLEIRIEDAEAKLLCLRRQALDPVRGDIQEMLSQTKSERYDKLCARVWEGRQAETAQHRRQSEVSASAIPTDGESPTAATTGALTVNFAPGVKDDDSPAPPVTAPPDQRTVPESLAAEMRAVEGDIVALRQLLNDMRRNAAAVVTNHIRQAEKGGGREAGKEAAEWGREALALLVSEDFAKQTMKELQKSAPHAKLTR